MVKYIKALERIMEIFAIIKHERGAVGSGEQLNFYSSGEEALRTLDKIAQEKGYIKVEPKEMVPIGGYQYQDKEGSPSLWIRVDRILQVDYKTMMKELEHGFM